MLHAAERCDPSSCCLTAFRCGLQLDRLRARRVHPHTYCSQQSGVTAGRSRPLLRTPGVTSSAAATGHPPMPAGSADTEAEHQFTNADGQNLYGTVLDAGTPELCILCHGWSTDRNGAFIPELAKELAKHKISTFRFDMTGNGKSEGEQRYGNYSHEAEDIRAATMKMRSLGFRVIGLLGHSKAGTVVLLYSSKYADIPRVVNVSGRFEQQTGVEERFGKGILQRLEKQRTIPMKGDKPWTLTYEDLNERMTTDMAEACSKIGNRVKVMTVHGKDDDIVPVSNGELYTKNLPDSQLEVIEGDHTFSKPEHRQGLLAKVVAFLQIRVDQSTI